MKRFVLVVLLVAAPVWAHAASDENAQDTAAAAQSHSTDPAAPSPTNDEAASSPEPQHSEPKPHILKTLKGKIPDLKGRWLFEADAVITPKSQHGEKGHQKPIQKRVKIVIDITAQTESHIIGHEVENSLDLPAEHEFARKVRSFGGMISDNGRLLRTIGQRGWRDCQILSDRELRCGFNLDTPRGTVVARGIVRKLS